MLTIFITPKQKETIDSFLKFKDHPYRLSEMSKDLKITSSAICLRFNQLKQKKLFTKIGRELVFNENLPYQVIERVTCTAVRKQQHKQAKENLTPVKFSGISREIVTYTRHSQRVRIDPPLDLPTNKYIDGKLTKIGIPKYGY